METNLPNVAGRAVGVLAALDSLRSPGGLGQFVLQRQAALADPSLRASLVGSPFTSGFFGVGGSPVPQGVVAGPAASVIQRAGFTPGQFVPNLPPLGPAGQVAEYSSRALADALRSSNVVTRATAKQFLKLPTTPEDDQALLDQATGAVGPGRTITVKRPFGTVTLTEPTEKPGTAPKGSRRFVENGIEFAETPSGQVVRMGQVPVGMQPGAADFFNRLFPQSPTPAPTAPPPAPAPSPAPAAPTLPGDDTPLGALPEIDGTVGYPSPAFDTGAATAPATAAPATAAPAALAATPQLPAGSSVTVGPRGVTATRKGPPIQGAQPAATQKAMSLLVTAPQAADEALRILQNGPQHPVEILGTPVYQPETFAGPVTGRALTHLAEVSGQPISQETAALAANIAHAQSGILSLLGARWTPEQKALFEPLLPSLNQPTEVLQVHLQRLARFYRSLGSVQGALANLNPAQANALNTLFFQTMTTDQPAPTAAPTPPPATPRVLDLR